MNRSVILLTCFLSFCSLTSRAQLADTLLTDFEISELDSILSFQDSLSIFSLIDSLLQVSDLGGKSSIAARLGYNSNATSSGRTLGISQFGLSPGISYYHKTGAYLDVSGYWSSEYDPSYYLTIISAGYIGVISPKWSFLGEYSRYLYSDIGEGVVISYKNSASLSNFIDVDPFTFRLDYSLLFGEKIGHRILPGVMLNLEKRSWRNIDRVLFYPSFNLLLGSEQIVTDIKLYDDFLIRFLLNRNRPDDNKLPLEYEVEERKFGIMNYSFTAPVSISVNNWNFLLSYTYNIPKSLPSEVLGQTNSGFISASVTRYFRFK